MKRRPFVVLAIVVLLFQLLIPAAAFAKENHYQEHLDSLKDKAEDAPKVIPLEKVDKIFPIKANQLKELNDLRKNYRKDTNYKAQNLNSINMKKVEDRRILVSAKEGFDAATYGVEELPLSKTLSKRGYRLVRVPKDVDYQSTLKQMNQDQSIHNAEPDYIHKISYVPSDGYYSYQWQYRPLNMEKAWDVSRGSTDTVVAVLDTGIYPNHPDLNGKILRGYDFVNEDSNPMDDHGHGTHVAGLIGAHADQTGIIGVNPKTKILPVKVADREGMLTLVDILQGIYYSIDQQVDIINMSFGGYQYSWEIDDALWEAYYNGIVLVAAAGNEGTWEPAFPASYYQVISVAATAQDDFITDFSNYGPFINLTSPGKDLLSTYYLNGYQSWSGTSFSAPIVSGLAALVKGKHKNWTPAEIQWAMEANAKTWNGKEWDTFDGYGIPDGYKMIKSSKVDLTKDVPDELFEGRRIGSGYSTFEKIDLPLDFDVYEFKVDREHPKVHLSVTSPTESMDMVMYVFDETMENGWLIDGNFQGEGEEATLNLSKGIYQLVVMDYYGHWSETPYELRMDDGTQDFPDVVGKWAEPYIEYLVDEGLMIGYPDGTFGFSKPITRAAAATVIGRELGLPQEHGNFKDVPKSHWASGYIGAMEKAGILTGYKDGTFRPDKPMTREEMAAVIVRAYELTGSSNVRFSDVDPDSWSYKYISTLVANGIVSGYPDGTFRPGLDIKRSEFAALMARLLSDKF
ncbi:S8 family serine peptidase [Halobacillus yeomjeoni]|uniref:S8 family serine peptidase n=1 Tax=Halobacillus yeomjeoni TaxID=311194 RepID=A0A931HWA0_9BACI|nr:S8 family serine peptidase [Halobacillus yeomjeoni]MBH0230719.1 S8 family serine peptidase [Halobacillus yeomjeoni]